MLPDTDLPGVHLLVPTVLTDSRGAFFEAYNRRTFSDFGISEEFVQDNHSRSARNVLRGLHYQVRQPQGKLVRVLQGEIFDVAVDLRKSSPNFGQWASFYLSSDNGHALWIPPGFAHGFLALSKVAELLYKTTDYWAPEHERCLIWNDPALGIKWPLTDLPLMSDKDKAGVTLANAELYP